MLDVPENGGRFVFWPGRDHRLGTDTLLIEPCTGHIRNGSGLAIIVRPPRDRPDGSLLLPGDAELRHVPSVRAGVAFDAIVCPHHGRRMLGHQAPACPKHPHPRLAYSFGAYNTYDHVLQSIGTRYEVAGWRGPVSPANPRGFVRDTATRVGDVPGHIGIGWHAPDVERALRPARAVVSWLSSNSDRARHERSTRTRTLRERLAVRSRSQMTRGEPRSIAVPRSPILPRTSPR